MNMECVNNTRK